MRFASGASSIPEALRLADNLQVARINAHDWAISARGLNANLANKLLVLVDGRAVYTPLYGGVLWNVQDCLLADIDRIEVISGPGGTLWGANAVNGVINIITKAAQDTQGLYAPHVRRASVLGRCRHLPAAKMDQQADQRHRPDDDRTRRQVECGRQREPDHVACE